MTTPPRRAWFCLGIVLAQLALGAAGVRCCCANTEPSYVAHLFRAYEEADWSNRPPLKEWKYPVCFGYPMLWAEGWQTVTSYRGGSNVRGPITLTGMNPLIPVTFGLLAVCLPHAAFGLLGRRRIASSRWVKLCSVLTLASLVGLFGAWGGNELRDGVASPFAKSLPDGWPPGTSIRNAYERRLENVQHYVWDHKLFGHRGYEEQYPADDWSSRIRWTVALMIGTAAGGCLVIRPWRRPLAENSSLAATTRPDS
jgi:hypothetical protein